MSDDQARSEVGNIEITEEIQSKIELNVEVIKIVAEYISEIANPDKMISDDHKSKNVLISDVRNALFDLMDDVPSLDGFPDDFRQLFKWAREKR